MILDRSSLPSLEARTECSDADSTGVSAAPGGGEFTRARKRSVPHGETPWQHKDSLVRGILVAQ